MISGLRRGSLGAAAGLLLVAWLLLSDALTGRAVFFDRDIHWVRFAQAETLARAVAAGDWPWWDPHPTFGAPALADPSFQLAYPTTWLNLVLPAPQAYAAFVLLHLLWAGLGLATLARRAGLSPGPAFVAAATWVSCGPFLSFANLFHHYAGLAWIPWVLVALEGLLERPGRRAALLLGAAGGMQVLAGSGDMALMGGLLAAARLLAWAGRRPAALAAPLPALALAAVVALGASAVQWLPTLSILREGSRLALPDYAKLYWSMPPALLVDWVVPRLVRDLPLGPELRGAWFEARGPFLACLYLGLPALFLAGLHALASRGRPRLVVPALAALFTLFALGRFTPVYAALCALPPFGIMRYPVKYMAVVGLLLALLAGLGLETWLGAWGRREASRARLLALVALLASVAFGAAAFALARPPGWLSAALSPGADPGTLAPRLAWVALQALALAALLTWRARHAAAPVGLTAACVLLLLGDLAAAGRGVNELAPPGLAAYRPAWIEQARALGVQRLHVVPLPAADAEHLAPPPPGWSPNWWWALGVEETLAPPIGGRWGLDGSYDGDFTGLTPGWVAAASRYMADAYAGPAGLRLLQLGSVDAVLTLREETGLGPRLLTFQSSFRAPVRLYRVPDPLPRVYVVDGVRAVPDALAYRLLGEPAFDLRREVLLPRGVTRPAGPGSPGSARVVARRTDALTVDVDLARDAYLVVTDAWSPGWRAEVDGRPAEVPRANVFFRAVAVPAGRHRVVMRYRPPAALAGAALSGLAWLACAAGLARGGIARRPAAA